MAPTTKFSSLTIFADKYLPSEIIESLKSTNWQIEILDSLSAINAISVYPRAAIFSKEFINKSPLAPSVLSSEFAVYTHLQQSNSHYRNYPASLKAEDFRLIAEIDNEKDISLALRKAISRSFWKHKEFDQAENIYNELFSQINDTSEEIRFSIEADELRVDGSYLPKEGARNLLVLFNGAVNRTMVGTRVTFQRHTWAESFNANCLFLADPTMTTFNNLALGWGIGVKELWAIPLLCGAIDAAVDHIEANTLCTVKPLLFGTSAGGFQALVTHSFIPGSVVAANNPQTDWTIYRPSSHVNALVEAFSGIPNANTHDFLLNYPERCSAMACWQLAGCDPSGIYLRQNLSSRDDIDAHLPPLLECCSSLGESYPESSINVEYYFNREFGHSPQSREEAVPWINEILQNTNR